MGFDWFSLKKITEILTSVGGQWQYDPKYQF